ncbi:MAG: nucleoside:proton symporter [Betaproteobacteria bacterium]|nr:nucleoside:proton symporter [Betaproteobacteria bacterium]
MHTAQVLQSFAGFLALHVLSWLISERRWVIAWRTVVSGMLLTLGLGLLLLKVPTVSELFLALNNLVTVLEQATQHGTSFVLGYLGGGPLPYEETQPGASFIFATRALPLVIVVSALSSLLFYWRILPWIVRAFSLLLTRTMGVGGAIGLSSAANVFVGMVEAPLFVRPYIAKMSRSELFVMMTCGMATIAGTVMVLYASVLGKVIPDILGHLLIASIISTPAAIVVSILMVPPEGGLTEGELVPSQQATSSMDAVTRGTIDGVALYINIIAMLVVLVALVALANYLLAFLPSLAENPITLQRILGWIMAPLVWVMGIPWSEAPTAGALMGTKTILNEFIAYLDLAALPQDSLSNRSELMMVYAMCGFANLGSLGIMIGGLTTMCPERREEIVSLGGKTIVSGTLATLIAGSVVGILY